MEQPQNSGTSPIRPGLNIEEIIRYLVTHRHSGGMGDGQRIPGGFLDLTGSYIRSPDGTRWYLHVNNAGTFSVSTTP